MIRISNIKIYENLEDNNLINVVTKKFKIDKNDILEWHIVKKSIDARKKDNVHYNYSIDFKLKNENKYKKFDKVKETSIPSIKVNNLNNKEVIIVGSGPSGLFSALTLIQNGIKPIVIEQGSPVDEREKQVEVFRKTGKLDILSNVQFGEGGAGTFSDGKLTTGIHSPFCKKVLEEFVTFGAPEEILYLSKPHIGTDKLIKVIRNIREYIISKGGKFLFNTKVIDFSINNNKISSVVCKNITSTYEINTSHLILAIGHSSRDTFQKLYEKGIDMEKKNFSVGLRIEHLQEDINKAQYGNSKLHLPPAEYKLSCHLPNGRSCYTFCMCPGRSCYCFF